MAPIEPTIPQIRAFASMRQIRPATLARLAGLHKNALRGLNEPDWNPRADTLQKLADAINAETSGKKRRAA